jgi:hypothetical protein
MLSVPFFYYHAECHYVECRYAECRRAESHSALLRAYRGQHLKGEKVKF